MKEHKTFYIFCFRLINNFFYRYKQNLLIMRQKKTQVYKTYTRVSAMHASLAIQESNEKTCH